MTSRNTEIRGGPGAAGEPSRDAVARAVRRLLTDPPASMPESLPTNRQHPRAGARDEALGVLRADQPLAALNSGGTLTGTVVLEFDGGPCTWSCRIEPDETSNAADRTFRLSISGLPDDWEPLALICGDLRLNRGKVEPIEVRVPPMWLPPTIDETAPAPRLRSDSQHRNVSTKLDDGPTKLEDATRPPAEATSPSEPVFLERTRELQVTAHVDGGRDDDARIVEVDWPTIGGGAAVDRAAVRLERNPRWSERSPRLRGTVPLDVPANVNAGWAVVTLRGVRTSDLPRHGLDAFLGRADLIDLPVRRDDSGLRFRVRYDDQRAALAAGGETCLLHLARTPRKGGRP